MVFMLGWICINNIKILAHKHSCVGMCIILYLKYILRVSKSVSVKEAHKNPIIPDEPKI